MSGERPDAMAEVIDPPRPASTIKAVPRVATPVGLARSINGNGPCMDEAKAIPGQKTGIGPWQPCWLGDPDRHLYASLHRAESPGAPMGVLLVAPLFHEQSRSRRLLAEMASGFAALGLHSLRFDFYGTADSAGNGDETDFASMCTDLDVATRALRVSTGVARVAVLACRAAALPVERWLRAGGDASMVILWEPIVDGAHWRRQLERDDAAERRSPERYCLAPRARAGATDVQLPGLHPPDLHLMGLPVSPRLLDDIAGARLGGDRPSPAGRYWAVLRDAPAPSARWERVFKLPEGSPTFDGSTQMDSGLFVTPSIKRVADELGTALVEVG